MKLLTQFQDGMKLLTQFQDDMKLLTQFQDGMKPAPEPLSSGMKCLMPFQAPEAMV